MLVCVTSHNKDKICHISCFPLIQTIIFVKEGNLIARAQFDIDKCMLNGSYYLLGVNELIDYLMIYSTIFGVLKLG